MSASKAEELLPYPIPNDAALDPPAEWEELRQQCPVAHVQFPSGDRATLLTRYDDVRKVLSDPRFGRGSGADGAGVRGRQPRRGGAASGHWLAGRRQLAGRDPDHRPGRGPGLPGRDRHPPPGGQRRQSRNARRSPAIVSGGTASTAGRPATRMTVRICSR